MLVDITKDAAIQKCNCGALNTIAYKSIVYDNRKLPQFRLPLCPECKTRIEFIIIGTNMTKEEMQLVIKAKEFGILEK